MRRTVAALRELLSNAALRRALLAWALFALYEYAAWIAMLVYAYSRGGATSAGIIALLQLAPGIVVAPLLSTLADRHSPARVLTIGYATQSVAVAAAAASIYAGARYPAYCFAVIAATALTGTRPAQTALLPALAAGPAQLTSAVSVQGWLDSVGIVLAGVFTGLAFAAGQPGLVFAGCTGALVAAAALTAGLHVPAMHVAGDGEEKAGALAGARVLRSRPQARVLVGLLTASYTVVGALDVLLVVLAVSVLREGQQWVGYLNTAAGVGGVIGGLASLALVGRRLTRPIWLAAALAAAALAGTAASGTVAVTVGLVVVFGFARVNLEVATRTLLQRSVPADLLARIFGVAEGLAMAGLAAGSVLAPALIALGGPTAALIGTAALVPLSLMTGGRSMRDLDSAASVPVTEIALLRAMPHFRLLPMPELEGLARAVRRRAFRSGDVIIRQGEPGEAFYAIAEGEVDVFVDGRHLGVRRRPEGLGEIALLRKVARTATVVANGPAVVYEIPGDQFLTVVTGHRATRDRAESVADSQQLRGSHHG